MRTYKQLTRLLFGTLFCVFSLFPLGAGDLAIQAADRVERGAVLAVSITGDLSESLTLCLKEKEGRSLFETDSFPYRWEKDGELLESAFIGIPSGLTTGEYRLTLTSGGELLAERMIEILPGAFRSEEIPLNRAMTKLRSEPDPKKVEQALEIQAIYTDFQRRSMDQPLQISLPVEGWPFSSYYGDRRLYLYSDGSSASSIHSGLDIAAPVGTPIYSGAPGRVRMAEDRIVSGKTLVIEYLPGVYGVFFHLSALDVEPGDLVRGDEKVGEVGATGLVTGAHLHWELRVSGVPVDPLLYVDRLFPSALDTSAR